MQFDTTLTILNTCHLEQFSVSFEEITGVSCIERQKF